MNKRKGIARKYRNQIMIIFVCIMMIAGQFPMGNYVFAQSNGYMHTTISEETDIHTQKINVSQIREGITKVELYKDGTLIETKPVSESLSFDVHKNGDYVLIGFNDTDTKQGEEIVHVDAFDDLMIEQDEISHTVTIVSRYHSTFDITVNGKDSLGAAEVSSGVYQAIYVVHKNGTYEFSVVDADGKVLDSSKLSFSDIPNISKNGETIISTADDLKQISANSSGSFILDQDIELKEDILSNINFTGTLNGDGYTISGITNQLFDTVTNAKITNIVIKGRLSDNAVNTDITNTGFYVEANDAEKDTAVILNGTDVRIQNSFAFMNVEGMNAAGFILNGTGSIEDSYVSGYINAKEDAYGFGREVNVKNSYITASLLGEKRVLFSEGECTDCFYDAQINDLEDEKATPYFTKDMISGTLKNAEFSETEGAYPQIKLIQSFKENAQSVSGLSVVSVSTDSNLSALEGSVDFNETNDIDWKKNSNEIKAESNEIVNRFSLNTPKTISSATAGASTTETTTQITYPVAMSIYYKVVKNSETAPENPKQHEKAINDGWKLMYWTGNNTASGLDWNTEYTIYSTDLNTVTKGETIKTNYGKNGGKLTLTGNYDVGQEMTAELTQTNITEGQWIWETAGRLDASSWNQIAGAESSTYTVTDNEKGKYLRVRFIADKTKGYEGELKAVTNHMVQEAITAVTIENRTSKNSTMTIKDQLVASLEPAGKDGEATFAWYYEGESDAIATGRNYTLKKEDIGKQLYVKAIAKDGGELKGDKQSALTETIQAIQCSIPNIADVQEKAHDDITVTLFMDTAEGLYQFGYATSVGGDITPYTTLSRAQTELTMTGLSANTMYYIYVRQVGENGYTDSAWSNAAYSFKTDAEHVRGDVIISGDAVYNKTLTAEIKNKPADHKGDFVWYRLDGNDERIISSKVTGTTYSLKKDDIGHKIEAVYEGMDGYAGEVTNISETVSKEEKEAPENNLTTGTATDTEIPVTMPSNSTGEKYILGISTTQNGIPIEQQEDGSVKEFTAASPYTIKNLNRDTTYYLFIRYAANETHQKSEWIAADKAVSKKTTKKEFSGTITFTYETESGKLMKGQTVKAILNPGDDSFNYKGIWTWTKTYNGKTTPINNFTISSDKHSTSYVVPENEDTGAVYNVTFEANVGYYGSQTAVTSGVQEPVKGKYEKPDANSIVMEPVDDGSIKLMMSEGEGLYQFYYREDDTNPADSIGGFFTKLFTGDDGYTKANKTVGANVDLIIDGLNRNTRYIVKVERVGDEKFETSDVVYSSEAATEYTSVTTLKTDIAGHVTLSGDEYFGGTLTAAYNKAAYASIGSGSDENGKWKWYRDDTEIIGMRGTSYILKKEDIGTVIKAEYTLPENEAFQGTVEASTKIIEKADCINPEITNIESKDIDGILTMRVTGTKSDGDEIYYRLQEASDKAPVYPNTADQLKEWNKVATETIDVIKDSNNRELKMNATYTIYYIKQESDIQKGSAVISKSFTMGTKSQTGTVEFSGDFVVGKNVTATLNVPNNTKGTWHWYMSAKRYGYDGLSAMPDTTIEENWTEITGGFSPVLNDDNSTLAITEDMFAHYIRVEFVADTEQGYSGEIETTDEQFVKKVYNETITITSSTNDGNGDPKAYTNSVITGTVNNYAENGNLDRTTVRFKIADTDGNGETYISGNDLVITDNTFTYKMPNKESYDGKEITAEVSTPKYPVLFINEDLKAITEKIVNSKPSSETSFLYTYGIPISNADEMEKFMKCEAPYNNRSANSVYVISNNINMADKGVIVYSETAFAGTLDGDFHTIVGIQNPIFANLTGADDNHLAVVKNIIMSNANINTSSLSGQRGGGAAVIARLGRYLSLDRIFVVNSNVIGGYDSGVLVGAAAIDSSNNNGKAIITNCGSAGSSIITKAGAASVGGLVGHFRAGELRNCFSINSSANNPAEGGVKTNNLGALVGSSNVELNNSYSSATVYLNANNVGGALGAGLTSNVYFDSTINPSIVRGGTPLSTSNMVGDSLKGSLGINDWVYSKGYYPRLTWMKSHPISVLYSATRGAFISIDNATSSDDMFNGNIYGVIQVPTELQTKDYKVTSSDESVLKIGDNGTIIPVGKIDEKAVITITYTEPDESIGGSASNTYEFTVKGNVKAMPSIQIQDDKTNLELTDNPKMNQKLYAYSTATGSSTYQWYKRKNGTTETVVIEGGNTANYIVKPSDIGYELAVLVKATGYASTYSNFTSAVTAIKPDIPTVSDVTDNSVILKPVNGEEGLTYEFGYVRADENASKTIVEETCSFDGSITVKNLERNKRYNFFVRVAAKEGSYEAGEWSDAASEQLKKTVVESSVLLGTAINNGTELTMRIESVNGQTGTWKLERLAADSDTVVAVINDNLSTANEAKYTLTSDDVGKRIRVTYTGRGNYEGTKTETTAVIKNSIPSTVPSAPIEVEDKKTDTTLTVKMAADGMYDIGLAESSNAEINVRKTKLSANTEYKIEGLKRNTVYYIYARTSEGAGVEASNWSEAALFRTAKSNVTGELTLLGDLKTDGIMKVKAPSMDALTGTWKVERMQGGVTTTIAPKDYSVDTDSNIISYKLTPRDALGTIKITFTGTGDYQGSITKTSSLIQNANQDEFTDVPDRAVISNIKDHTVNVAANKGTGMYQFGYAPKGEQDISKIIWNDATGEAGKSIQLSGMERNTEYEIYARIAAKTGYNASNPIRLSNRVTTAKTILNGSLDYVMQDGEFKVGVAEIGKTYKATYTSGKYEQSGSDLGGSWQWYADDQAIDGATFDSYTIEAMEGTPEISVRYIAKEDSGFDSFVKISVGTLTKPVFDAPSVLPQVTAMGEDGEIGSMLKITSSDFEHVFYYVQKADNTTVPAVKYSSEVTDNEAALDQWFRAAANVTVTASPDTEYVVYAARLEDGEHQSSGVVSQRAVRTAKEELDKLAMIRITESDSTKWKVLQDKELHIDIDNKAVDGIWQYYVTKDNTDDNSWQNITSEIKAEEGKKAEYAYTAVNMPVKYYGYYVKAVFTGRGSFKGNKVYTSTDKLIGTQIKGSVQITSGDSSQVFTPIVASYVFAKNPDGTEIIDEKNGIWTWYRETGAGTNKYTKIENGEEHIGLTDTYTPTAEDVGKKIYAEYTGAPTNIYSGSVRSNYLSNVAKSEQIKPAGLSEKQVNGTTIQVVLPSNYEAKGKSIPDVILEYRIKDSSDDWTVNDSKTTWIGTGDKKLKANTTYEIRAKFAGTSEYKPSTYSDLLYVTTDNQLFDEDNLTITAPEKLETDAVITAAFTGDGYDEGNFIISRSDGTVVKEESAGSITPRSLFRSGTNTIEYTVTSADIGNNIIVQYKAKDGAATYGGAIEKNTKEVLKPVNPSKPGSPTLETTRLSETTLKFKVNDNCEYVFNESAAAVSESSGSWSVLEKDDTGYHTFTGLSKEKTYYLHARYHETATYRYGAEDVSAGTKPWASSQYTITYEGTEGAANTNPTQYTELSDEITLSDASKDGYTFTGWTVNDGDTPAKELTIPSGSDGNKTFKAHWSVNTYNITYTLNGGTLKTGESNPETYTIETDDFTLKNPEKKGYTFLGWTWDGESTPATEVVVSKGTFGDKAYTANWKLNTYNITYNLDGGTNHLSNPTDYTVESETITIEEPTKSGYDFLGWTWDGQTSAVKSPQIDKGSAGDITYTANWKASEYAIRYDLDNGVLEIDKTNPESYTIESEDITLNNPTKKGYTFKGWSTGDGDTPVETVTITKGSTGAKSYKAIWEENVYTITYVMDGGTNHADNPSGYKITDADITLNAPTRTGYVFKGWKADGVGEVQETVTITSGSTGNLSYTATWEKVEYTVIFDSKEGSAVSQAGVKFEEKITKPADPTKEGYTFAGWFKETTLDNEWNFDSDVVTANITLYAKWTINEYQATFDVNGGDSVDPVTITKNYQEELGTLPTASRTGYSFVGWFTAATGGDQITDKTKMPVNGATYYAYWTINQYTVKFDGNGGTDGTEIKKNYDAEIGELPTSTRAGYTFDGWYTEATEGTKVTTGTKMPSKDTTYYAHWTINQYTVKFDGNGGSNGTDITADYDSELGALPTSTREGYTFDGWYTEKTGGIKISSTTKMPLDGATYYAQWKTVDYTITYDLNDGNSGEAKNHDNNPSKYTIESNTITLENPSWTGRVFTGWTWDGHDTKELVVTIDKGTTGNKTYKANWELAAYTVTFDSVGGSDVADVPAQHGKPIVKPSDPIKEGYTFKGWYTSNDYAAEWNFDDAVMKNMQLFAKWEINHYAVSFNTNGGSSIDAQTVDHGEKASQPTDPTKEYYSFAGWYSDDKLTTEFDFANTEIKGETTIYAKWTPVIYNIAYDLDGGSVTLDKLNPIFYTVETETFTLNNPTKTGYEFKGWSTGDDSKAETTVTIAKGTSGDLSYKAVWEKKSYAVTFDSTGGSAVEDALIKYEEKVTKPSDSTKAGYTFAGWYKETACENVWDFDNDVVTDETTLYAKWTANRYIAVFDKNEGDAVNPTSIEKDYQEELGTLPTATRTGYSFAGWFTAATGGDQITDKTKMPLNGATYYAQWTINQYTVKFDGNGGIDGTEIKKNYDVEIGELPTSTRAGYTFDGWYTEMIGGMKVEPTTKMPSKDTTYYAHWTINQYTVKFDGNGGSNGTDITADYDSELGTLPTSTREGYIFDGWYTEKIGGTKIQATTKMPLDGATYYAQWKTVDYTITYDMNDGNSNEAVNHKDNPASYTIESSEITLKAPSWKNHVFTGWTWAGHDTKEMIVKIDAGTTGNKVYRANWIESDLTVKYDTQGGSAVEDALAAHGVPISKPDDPTREGYTFKGWYTSTTYETEWNFDDNVVDNMTLYAKWEINRYNVMFNTNGGSDIDDQIINHGEKANKPADPTKEYYSFTGWYSDAKLTKEFKFDSAIQATTTLYAKWTPVKYDITYDLNGGDNHKDNPAAYTVEDEITLKAPVKKNYTFLGWTYKGQKEPQKIVTIVKGTHDALSYTANWKLNEYAVDFNTNSDDVIASVTVQHGSKITRPEKEPVKAGYVFKGWYADEACTKAWNFENDVVTGKTTLYAGYKDILKAVEADTKSETNINKGDTVKLTAPKGADIYFTVNGTDPTRDSQKYKDGIIVNETMTIKAIAVKDGYADSSVAIFTYYVKGKASINTEDSLVELSNKPEELIEAVLQEDEYKQYLMGTDVMVRISCKPINKIEDKEVLKLLNGRIPSNYYDIIVYKTVGDKDEVTVETLRHPIRIILDVPKELYPESGVTREFKVLRIHEGKNALLDDLDDKLETVTFESDAFSSYILCYKDITKDEAVVSPAEKPKNVQNEITKGEGSSTVQQPAAGDEQTTAKEENPEKKLEKAEKEKAKEKEEAKNTVYFFLIPIALLLAICIAFIMKFKHKAAAKN